MSTVDDVINDALASTGNTTLHDQSRPDRSHHSADPRRPSRAPIAPDPAENRWLSESPRARSGDETGRSQLAAEESYQRQLRNRLERSKRDIGAMETTEWRRNHENDRIMPMFAEHYRGRPNFDDDGRRGQQNVRQNREEMQQRSHRRKGVVPSKSDSEMLKAKKQTELTYSEMPTKNGKYFELLLTKSAWHGWSHR